MRGTKEKKPGERGKEGRRKRPCEVVPRRVEANERGSWWASWQLGELGVGGSPLVVFESGGAAAVPDKDREEPWLATKPNIVWML